MTWDIVWMICKMECQEDLEEVCLVECSSTSVACLEVVAVVVEWLLTLMRYSKCLWANKWEVWMTVASKVLWDEVEEEVVDRRSAEWVDFNNKDVALEGEVVDEEDQDLLSTCEEHAA